ncbi:hypothetical protein cypCar_00029196 [Cyprinus carpio]|nr:hypothetical protein cypCar_00029196 [Cyprinus carpio]
MAQLTPAGLVFCAFCLITQVLSQNTMSPINSTALAGNQTVNANDTLATNANTAAANATTTAPAGAGVLMQASVLNVLVPIAMATGLLQRWC